METQSRRLPVLVALIAFVIYVATMGGEVTANSLPLAAKLAGWDEKILVGQPLLWLLTLPLRLLPGGWVPLAVKLLAAALAAAILGLIARTVQFLPWDHPWDKASRLTCVLPILTAAIVCGLQFNFWQEATSTCAELLDLLLLTAAVWLLLEYNVRQQTRWLDAAALVWGVGMAENWVMLLTLPLFIAAVIWIEGLRFFRSKFVLHLAGLVLAGFSLYAVLPLANGWMSHGLWTLGQSWNISLHQTAGLFILLHAIWQGHRLLMIAVVIYYLVPTLPMVIRMRDEGTHNKSGSDRFQIWLYRALRLGLLLACFWLAFDPAPGARQMLRQNMIGWPLLTFDYMLAIGAAFLLGNLLLIPHIVVRDEYRRPQNQIAWQRWTSFLVATGLALIALGLIFRNAPPILHANFHPLQRFGDLAVKSLPPGRGVLLSDDAERLAVFRAALAGSHRAADWLTVETSMLPNPRYRARLEQRLPAGWLTDQNRHDLRPTEMLLLLGKVARTNRLFYLHPSFGLFFEGFYLEPTGSIFEMKRRGHDPLDVPPLTDAALAANEQFWSALWQQDLSALVPPASPPLSAAARQMHLGLVAEPRDQDRLLANWFANPLEAWAVTLQKQGRLREAQLRFEQVLQLNSSNSSARLSLTCNTNLQAGLHSRLADVHQLVNWLGDPNRVQLLVRADGPFDEPTFDYVFGVDFLSHGQGLQAAEQLQRARTLAPDALAPQIALADAFNQLQMPERSRPLINQIREEMLKVPSDTSLDLNLALLDSYAWRLQTNASNAREVLQSLVSRHPDDPGITARVIALYLAFHDFTNALHLVEARLVKAPNDIATLSTKADILMRSGRAAEAIPVLDHILALTNAPEALLNRAFAHLQAQDFTSASKDLNELELSGHHSAGVDFAVGLLAEHNANTNSAKRYLQLCLSNALPNSLLWREANAHFQRLASPVTPK